MSHSACPVCGITAVPLRKRFRMGISPTRIICQGCKASLRHHRISLLLGFVPMAMIVPAFALLGSVMDTPRVPPVWQIYLTLAVALSLIPGSFLGAVYLSWRTIPLVPYSPEDVAGLEASRRPLRLAWIPPLYPAVFFGFMGLVIAQSNREGTAFTALLTALIVFGVVWGGGIAILRGGAVHQDAGGKYQVKPAFIVGVLGALAWYYIGIFFPPALWGVLLWPLLVWAVGRKAGRGG